jgi:hypothetical protein
MGPGIAQLAVCESTAWHGWAGWMTAAASLIVTTKM